MAIITDLTGFKNLCGLKEIFCKLIRLQTIYIDFVTKFLHFYLYFVTNIIYIYPYSVTLYQITQHKYELQKTRISEARGMEI